MKVVAPTSVIIGRWVLAVLIAIPVLFVGRCMYGYGDHLLTCWDRGGNEIGGPSRGRYWCYGDNGKYIPIPEWSPEGEE